MKKKIKAIFICIGIELFFFIGTKPPMYESFFLLFVLLFSALFIYNIFDYGQIEKLKGVSGRFASNANTFNSKRSEDLYGTDQYTKRIGGGIKDKSNFILLLFALLNGLMYYIVMPK